MMVTRMTVMRTTNAQTSKCTRTKQRGSMIVQLSKDKNAVCQRSCKTEEEVDFAKQLMWQVAEAVVQGEDPYDARARILKSTMETDDDKTDGDKTYQGAATSSTVTTPPIFTKVIVASPKSNSSSDSWDPEFLTDLAMRWDDDDCPC